GPGRGLRIGEYPGVYMAYGDSKMSAEFAQRLGMTVWFNQRLITNINLKGSYAAMVEMENCQKYIDPNRSAPTPSTPAPQNPDPFKGQGRNQPVSDPFRM